MNLSSTSPSRLPDFRVTYRLFTAEEGGRKTPAYQGIRWDFRYEDKAVSTGTWIIHPEFLGLTGEALPTEFLGLTNEAIAIEPLPMLGQANMFILSPELRSFHQQHLRLGTRGYFVEGPRRVGVCEVVEIMNLRKASVA